MANFDSLETCLTRTSCRLIMLATRTRSGKMTLVMSSILLSMPRCAGCSTTTTRWLRELSLTLISVSHPIFFTKNLLIIASFRRIEGVGTGHDLAARLHGRGVAESLQPDADPVAQMMEMKKQRLLQEKSTYLSVFSEGFFEILNAHSRHNKCPLIERSGGAPTAWGSSWEGSHAPCFDLSTPKSPPSCFLR